MLYPFTSRSLDVLVKGEIITLMGFLLSFVFALYILPQIVLISKKKRLYDVPDTRKCHTAVIPRLGGLAFVPSILFSLSLTLAIRFLMGFPLNAMWMDQIVLEFLFAVGGVTLLYLVGAKDDLVGVRYRKKFLAQFFVASLLPLSGLYINNLYGLLGIYTVPEWIGVPLTIVAIVYITNAVNLIDGIDGLAAGGAAVSFLVFGFLFFERELYIYSTLSLAVVGCLLPFIYYNVFGGSSKRSKIFMGDAGSLTLGYLLAFLSIKYAMYIPEYIPFNAKFLLFPIVLLCIPVFDAVRVMLVRAYHHRPLFVADRNHIHHKCLDTGMTHLQATGFLLTCDVLLLLLNIVLIRYLNINFMLGIDIVFFLMVIVCLEKVTNKK